MTGGEGVAPALLGLARLYPWDVTASERLRRALRFLGVDAGPDVVVRAGYGLGTVVAAATLGVTVLFGFGPLGLVVSAALGLLSVHTVHETPCLLALARRTRALGRTPDLVARAVLRMRIEPSPERAAVFAAESGEGSLAESLRAHVRRGRVTGENALVEFGAEWAEWYPELERAAGLVSAAGRMEARDREQALDRALSVALEGAGSRMRSFATRVSRPVTALYAFGVLLPTALVALLPAASASGVGVTTGTVVVVYDLLLPLGIVAAGLWLVARRPVAFPPPDVGRSHPEVPDRRRTVLVAAVSAATVGLWLAGRLSPAWTGPFAAVGLGAGAALSVHYRPVVAVYGRVREVEAGLTDALALVGRRVANGAAVESAVRAAATDLDGAMGEVLDRAVARQRQLGVGPTVAFLGDDGALSEVPSPRVRGSVAVLGLAAREGQPVGAALLALADHVDDLRRVEAEARRDLDEVCGTLRNTGALFGPMVAGSTVALADRLAGGPAVPGNGHGLPVLGLAVGGYVVASAVVLPALATSLSRGFDGPLVGYRVGCALLLATPVYLGSYLLVGGIA
jgi:Flp pilus assembly protein TadB